jgi:hypothetical protein
MNREEKIADLVQRWIPDELRLDTRHDAKLVSSAITTVIMAVYDSDRITMKAQSSDVNAALKTWFDTTFSEHMRAEDEHMKGLEEKASSGEAIEQTAELRIPQEFSRAVVSASRSLEFMPVSSLGTGDYGVAIETADGMVVKITTDEDESELASILADEPTVGFVVVSRGPVSVGTVSGKQAHAYMRERVTPIEETSVDKVPESKVTGTMSFDTSDERSQSPFEWASDSALALLKRKSPKMIARYKRAIDLIPERFSDIAAGMRALLSKGIYCADVRPRNFGTNSEGKIVAFDFQGFRDSQLG